MKQRVLVNEKEVEVDLDAPETSVVEVEPGIYSVILSGRSFEARVLEGGVEVSGFAFKTEVLDPRSLPRRKAAAEDSGQRLLRAPMPGKVVRVLVSVGQNVSAGQGILVMEAMKMQNEMKAPRAGVVVSLHVEEGAAVGPGELLAVIE